MQETEKRIKERIRTLTESGECRGVLGWVRGESFYDNTPAIIPVADAEARLVYDDFCVANLSKYLIGSTAIGVNATIATGSLGAGSMGTGGKSPSIAAGGADADPVAGQDKEACAGNKIIALLKPCDTYGFNQLVTESRIRREDVYVIGVPCDGMIDIEAVRAAGVAGLTGSAISGDTAVFETLYGNVELPREDVLAKKCFACKGSDHVAFDEIVDKSATGDGSLLRFTTEDRFSDVSKLESMTPEERFDFWRNELSRCIRCNACRNICPACSCVKCVFDNPESGVDAKANTDAFEEDLFHSIRAWHVAGRCSDCGECSRVCPQGISLHLLNRKFIKDINGFFGTFQAGESVGAVSPLTEYKLDDTEPDGKGEAYA